MNIAQHLGPDYPTVESLLAATCYNPHQKVSLRAYLVHENLTPVPLPPQGQTPGRAAHDISRYVTDVKYDANVANVTARSCTFDFEAFPGFGSVNLIRDLVQLTYCFFDPSATIIREVSLGYFSFVVPDETYSDATLLWNVQAQDLTSRIARKGNLNTYTFPSGLPVTTGMSAYLQMDKKPPSRGGRKPSGVVWPGTPQSRLPANQSGANVYVPPTSSAVHVSTVLTTADAAPADLPWETVSLVRGGELWLTVGPLGYILYNPLADILVDPVTFAPIDPWTQQPMPQSSNRTTWTGAGVFTASYSNLLYITVGGFFTYAGDLADLQPGGTSLFTANPTGPTTGIDPYKLQPLPSGRSYKFLVGAGSAPLQTWGNCDLPLATWPHDYDGSGPYFQGATATTEGVAAPISELIVPGNGAVARRGNPGSGPLTMLSSSQVKLSPPLVCAPDSNDPGTNWCQAPPGIVGGTAWTTSQIDVSGLTTPADQWFATVYFQGTPAGGTLKAQLHMFLRHADNTITELSGDLSDPNFNQAQIDWADLQGQSQGFGPAATIVIPLVPALNPKPGDTLCVQISLEGTLVTFPPAVQNAAEFDFSHIHFDLPAGSTQVPHTAMVTPTTPTSTGTWVPFPDSANPALTPAGCETIGANWPADRIHIVPRDAVFPSPYPLSVKMNAVAGLNQLADTIQYHHILVDTDGNLICGPSIFSTNTVPTPVLHLSTEKNGSLNLHPTVGKKLLDQTTIANVFSARSEPNQNVPPLKSVAWNDSPNSYISIENAGDTILRSAQVDTILDQGILDDYAREQLDWAAIGQLGLTLTMWPIPWLELYDPILVTVVSPDGTRVVTTDPGNPFIVTQFSIDIKAKTMVVNCNRFVPE